MKKSQIIDGFLFNNLQFDKKILFYKKNTEFGRWIAQP